MRQVLDNLHTCVEAAGGSLDDVVKLVVYFVHIEDRPIIAELRLRYVENAPPAGQYSSGGDRTRTPRPHYRS